jgi:thiol-disulfide isomerase/thioredoxin
MKVIKIGAVWCNGCLVMRPRWAEIEKENPWLMTEYLDYDQEKERVAIYKVEGGKLPVAVFLDKNNQELTRFTGEVSKDVLVKALELYQDR